jgi:hypothetical protein
MARIVLHVGTHKTATTTLQNTLGANRARLAERGIVYPKIRPGNAHHSLATQWIELPDTYRNPAPAAELWREVAAMARDPDATVILSSEEFSRWRPKAVDFAELARLVAAFDERLVVCTLRNQLAYLQSIYLQVSREWSHLPFEAFIGTALRDRHATGVSLDYGALYDRLLAGFAPSEIRFLCYETATRHQGGVVGAFLAAAGLAADDLVPLAAGDSNVSPEPLAAWAANQIVSKPPTPDRLIAHARAAFAETFGGTAKSTLYSRDEAKRLAASFAPLNAAFEARYRAVDPDFALAPLSLAPDLVYRGQLATPFWIRFGKRLYAQTA